ncbi:hypothetical protein [Pseudomonas sp. ML96]|uniref:hypothetical protein n=1 Tax=Pseudomonas sp. ML96 TaxID=1523503 RepID=UPI0005BE2527|nr:hypothetical protein [Pseudomonas sp. ML96]
MPTVYSREDSGAPVLSYVSTQGSIAQFTAVKTILKACLVSGYSGKPAAGWSLVAEGDRHLVLRNGTQTGYVCLTWTGGNYLTVYLAETFTGVVSDVITGDGVKTGVAANNATQHRLYIGVVAYNTNYCSWLVLADERTFIFQSAGATGANWEFIATDGGAMAPLYVGEDSTGRFLAIGGSNTTLTSPNNDFSYIGLTALRDPVTGLLIGTGSITPSTPGLGRSGTATATVTGPVVPLIEASLAPVRWGTFTQLAGKLRGVALCPQLSEYYPSPAARCLGYSGPLITRNANQQLPMGPDRYYMGLSYPGSCRHLLTDKAEFW